MEKISISIAKEFTRNPGGRYKDQGEFSGQEFREQFLEPFFKKNEDNNNTMVIDLDGLNGYPSSFFEEAFGGLARRFETARVINALRFECKDNPLFIADITAYIKQEDLS